jgi:predicted RNA-binding protein YlxR (DUF448 family)
MSRAIRFNPEPTSRLLQVFDRRHRSRGCWLVAAESCARAELAKHRGGSMWRVDEDTAKLPHWGHVYRVVVGQVSA